MTGIKPKYELKIIVEPPTAGKVNGGGTYIEGKTVQVVATSFSGWKFTEWIGDELSHDKPNLEIIIHKNIAIIAKFKKTSNRFLKQESIEPLIFVISFLFSIVINIQNKLPFSIFMTSLFLSPIIGFSFSKCFRRRWILKLILFFLLFHTTAFLSYYLGYPEVSNAILYTNFWSGFLLAITNIVYRVLKP